MKNSALHACFKLLALLLSSTIGTTQTFTTTNLAPLPMATSNNAVAEGFSDGKAYVYSFGGIDESKIYSGLHLRSFRLDVEANSWTELDPLPDSEGKIASSANRVGDIIYIIGGYHVAPNGNETSSKKVHRFDILNNRFLADGTEIPVAIDDQVQIVRGQYIYVITGWSNNRNVPLVQVYDTANDSWASANDLPDTNDFKVFGASGTILGDTIYYYGGASGGNFAATKVLRKGVIDVNDHLSIEWSTIKAFAFPNAYRPAATLLDGRPAWLGGSNVSYNYDGIAYNGSGGVAPANTIHLWPGDGSGQWASYSVELPMDLRSVASLSDSVKVIVGGMVSDQEVTSNTVQLNFSSKTSSNSEIDKEIGVRIYPNPTLDSWTIEKGDLIEYENISVYDGYGKLLLLQEFQSNSSTIVATDWPSGFYCVRVGTLVRKIVKL